MANQVAESGDSEWDLWRKILMQVRIQSSNSANMPSPSSSDSTWDLIFKVAQSLTVF